MEPEGYRLGRWQDGQTTLTAWGPDPVSVISVALAGLLAASRGEVDAPEEEATTALAIRAEGSNVAELFLGLAAALLDEIDHEEYDVRAVRFDGMVRTDLGLAGWGYALAVPGEGGHGAMAVDDVAVTDESGVMKLRTSIRQVS